MVSVCSPDSTHAEYATRALRAGKHVLCEKPLADSAEGCAAILHEAMNAGDRVIGVQHQMRFVKSNLAAKEAIDGGQLGPVAYLEGYYVHDLRERAFRYHEWRAGGTATPMVYCGCHIADLMLWLLGEMPTEVFAFANHLCFPDYPESDLNVAILRFPSGAVGTIVVALGAGRPQDHSLRIYGPEGAIENNVLFKRGGAITATCLPSLDGDVLCGESLRSRLRAWRSNVLPWALGRAWRWIARAPFRPLFGVFASLAAL